MVSPATKHHPKIQGDFECELSNSKDDLSVDISPNPSFAELPEISPPFDPIFGDVELG